MDPASTEVDRLQCPELDASRYAGLQAVGESSETQQVRYYFALDLRECVTLLPRLIGSVVETIRFLGPQTCALSIIEGNSPDGTGEVLAALRTELDALTTTYHFRHSGINPAEADRIIRLAELRNMALRPMLGTEGEKRISTDTTVVFLNDVAICPEDILELVYQRSVLKADMTCAMDWTYVGEHPTFYDVWIARGMTGESFFNIPPDGNWNSAWNLFWNDHDAKSRLEAHRPFQVFSCWNGAAVFTAKPIVGKTVAFRASREGECFQGEPQLFCKDLWFHGYGKIAVVPSVNLEYSDEKGRQIKEYKGYTSQWVGQGITEEEEIEWQSAPPEGVKCIPAYDDQYFEAWNATQI